MATIEPTTGAQTSAINQSSGYTGLGAAEFAALAMHEKTLSSAITLSLLGLDDETIDTLLAPISILYGRSSLAARGLMSVDGDAIEPAEIGRLVAHATANATCWMNITLATGEGLPDAMLVADAPSGTLVIVRRALLTFQVAATTLSEGRTGFVWDALERHLAAFDDGIVVVGSAFPDGSASKQLIVRMSGDGEDNFEIALTDDLDDEPADAVTVVTEDELDAVLSAVLRGPGEVGAV